MLRITIEVVPGGRESGRRTIAVAEITRASRDCTPLASYEVTMSEEYVWGIKTAKISHYPRWSSSIWDLVIRGIAKALTGKERLPLRPVLLNIPVHSDASTHNFVLLSEIPEPARAAFCTSLIGSTTPRRGGAYAHDWFDFLAGRR